MPIWLCSQLCSQVPSPRSSRSATPTCFDFAKVSNEILWAWNFCVVLLDVYWVLLCLLESCMKRLQKPHGWKGNMTHLKNELNKPFWDEYDWLMFLISWMMFRSMSFFSSSSVFVQRRANEPEESTGHEICRREGRKGCLRKHPKALQEARHVIQTVICKICDLDKL